jgi:16S rRNA (guanine527-N7)-methyltransferase
VERPARRFTWNGARAHCASTLRTVPDAVDARLAELTAQYDLPDRATERLRGVLGHVEAEPTSITTVRDPAQGVELHVADSLAGLEVEQLREAGSIADLGAGGGFPGLVLAVALPAARITLVESVGKKCEFLRRTAADLGLHNVTVVNARAEAWREGIGSQDAVTARALAPLSVLAEYAAPLLADGGALVAWKGRRDRSEEADGAHAAEVLGLEPLPPRAVSPIPGANERHLYVYLKVAPTPDRFPRREGIARKRPLQRSTAG